MYSTRTTSIRITSILTITTALYATGCASQPLERTEPPRDQLGATQAAALGGRWSNMTTFCVDASGVVGEPSTLRSSGDPLLDLVYIDTVKQWRYKPGLTGDARCPKIRFDHDFGAERTPESEPVPLDTTAKKVAVVLAYARHKPEPPGKELAALAAETGVSNWLFVNRTSFCVETDGSTVAVKSLRSSGIPAMDRILRDTVASWIFSPFMVDGQPKRVCSEVSFDVQVQ